MNIKVDELPPIVNDKWIGIDLEIFDMIKRQMHRPTNGKFALMSIAIDDDVYLLTKESQITPALNNIQNNWHIFHNAKFDITQIRRWADYPPRKRVWDTMLMERILWGGYYDSFGLDDLVRRYLFTHMEKELQKSFSGNELTAEQLRYSARDAWVLPKIVAEQRKLTTKDDFYVWMEIDRPAMFAFMDFLGFGINVEAWNDLAMRNKLRQKQIDDQLPFNPRSGGSKGQVVQSLQKLGFKKIPDSGEETISKFIEKYPDTEAAKLAAMVLESRTYGKRASTYGSKFIDDFLEHDQDGFPFIYANYWVIGAETGRTSCSDPNMQNIPARETKEFRECFIARPKHKLLVADYSAQEPFISAYVSQDPALIAVCNSGKDIYIAMAKLMFGVDINKQDPLRKHMKGVVLGANYGMSVEGLARRENISIEEAEETLERRRKAFPRYDEYTRTQAAAKNKVHTVAGRTIWLNHWSGQAPRNALNGPIQGSAGDCMKQALANLHTVWIDYHNGFVGPFPTVGYIHDELVLDVPEDDAEDTKVLVRDTMVNTANKMFPGLNFRADVSIGNTWADKA